MVEAVQWLAWPPLAVLIALPALAAWRRRRKSREISAVAEALLEQASADALCPLDDVLQMRLARLRIADTAVLQLAQESPHAAPLRADCAQRLGLRLRRRVAFDRKMLARAAPGLRRGAVAASAPPIAALALQSIGIEIPVGVRAVLLLVEIFGCVLLWRLARVEI